MTQKHVDLLMKAANLVDNFDGYLCNRIEYITCDGLCKNFHYDPTYSPTDGEVVEEVIMDWLYKNCPTPYEDAEPTFYDTKEYREGMTRLVWAETLLSPLVLLIPEEGCSYVQN